MSGPIDEGDWIERSEFADHPSYRRRVVGGPVSEMFHPGKCRWCGAIYDGGKVEVTARYSDCSVWKSPCCNATTDDRPVSWGGSFKPLTSEQRRRG